MSSMAFDSAANDAFFMQLAMLEAQKAYKAGEVPIGAVIVQNGQIVGRGYNQPISLNDPSAHAEMMALRAAAQQLANYRLVDCDLYVTAEPCTMCAGAMIHARIDRLIFGTTEPKAGRVVSNPLLEDACFNHTLNARGGVLADHASQLIKRFFAERRSQKKKAKRLANERLAR